MHPAPAPALVTAVAAAQRQDQLAHAAEARRARQARRARRARHPGEWRGLWTRQYRPQPCPDLVTRHA